jgi:predicted glycosyltransferase
MIGFGGTAISHVGRLLGIASISFYDSENATLQTRITWPFIDHLYVPDAYDGPTPAGRTTRLPGTKELSYLHPTAFFSDRSVAIRNGLDPDVDNFFLRVVGWQASHDIGKSGWTGKTLRSVIARLGRLGRVHVSSEIPLPEDLESLRYSGSVTDVHHLMANCRLLVGESATMASEAAILGVPAIYCGRDFPGYVRELETAGLVYNLPIDRIAGLLDLIDRALAAPPAATRAARDRYVSVRPDWALAVVEAIDRAIASSNRRQS